MLRSLLERLEASRFFQHLRFYMNHRLVHYLEEQVIDARSNLRIAELACGSGFSAHLLAQNPSISLSLAGDINLNDFREAAIGDFQATFTIMDLFKPPLQPESLDLVWNSSSVEEFDDPLGAVKSMALLTRRGGYVFVGVPNRYGLAGLLNLLPGRHLHTWLGRVYSRKQLCALLEAANLRVEDHIYYLFGVFVGVLAQKV